MSRTLILGATGRLGGMLRRHWSGDALWLGRRSPGFDILTQQDWPRDVHADTILCLAGVVPGAGDLELNIALGRAAVALGAQAGVQRVLLASSAAVYGGGVGALTEGAPLAPVHPYGRAKWQMESEAAALGAALGVHVTALRIGNVAGADALLAQDGPRRILDRFADGQGPRRSYIGPRALAQILAGLSRLEVALPKCLNIALEGPVAMADLCAAAGLEVEWRPAPPEALPEVTLDTRRLARIMPVPKADPAEIIADWRADERLKGAA